MPSYSGTTSDRQRLREHFRVLRRQLMTAECQAAINRSIGCWLRVHAFGCVGIYAPTAGEADIRPAVDVTVREKRVSAVAYPVVDDEVLCRMHYESVTAATRMQLGAFGIAEPVGGVPVVPDVIFSPCVAVTPSGFRLGNGGGFFDRWLANRTGEAVMTVAVAAEGLVTTDFEPLPHDRPFQWLATENGVRRVSL